MSFLLFTIFCLDFVASAFFYFIAGEKCNFQVKFAFVHPPVCKNWLKLGKAKTSFFIRYTLGCQTSKFAHKYLLENMHKFSFPQFIWRYEYKMRKISNCFVLKFKQTSVCMWFSFPAIFPVSLLWFCQTLLFCEWHGTSVYLTLAFNSLWWAENQVT